jgi:hypothetical protein
MSKQPTRRDILLGSVATAAAGSGAHLFVHAAAPRSNPIIEENQRPGTNQWQLTYIKFDAGNRLRQSLIEGYCTRTSVAAGETIGFCVSTNPPTPFHIAIYRLGYYGGSGGRLMTTLGPFEGRSQEVPPRGDKRLRECQWKPCVEITIPPDWLSGVYLAQLNAKNHRYQSYCIFIVRDSRRADLLFQCSTNTWQAYNKWPAADSLYDNDRPDRKPLVSGVRVSFDRPYARYWQVTDNPLSLGSGEFLLFEFPFSYWLEQHGYDVTYCANEDVDRSLDSLLRCKVFLSVGHDEYWTRRQFDHCLEAVRRGVHFGFFSGNTCCFVLEASAGKSGQPHRIIERVGRYGGIRPGEEKYMADLPVQAPNEATLIGAQTVSPFNGSGDWICRLPKHWIFEGTGMRAGEAIPGLVGWEFHGDPADIPSLQVVASGKTWTAGEAESHYEATIYSGPKGNIVFNASTIFWAQGLSSPPGHWLPYVHNGRPHGPDPRVQRITHNLLRRWREG